MRTRALVVCLLVVGGLLCRLNMSYGEDKQSAPPEKSASKKKSSMPHRRLKGGFKGRPAEVDESAATGQRADDGQVVITNTMVRQSEPPGSSSGRSIRKPAAGKQKPPAEEHAPSPPAGTASSGPEPKAPPTADTPETAEAGLTDLQGHGKSYWKERASGARDRVEQAQRDLDEAEARVSRDENDFYSWDDGQYRDNVIKPEWDRAKEAVERSRKELGDAKAALENLEDEARKAGALPGWIREP